MSTTTRRLDLIEVNIQAHYSQPARPPGFDPENLTRVIRAVENGEALTDPADCQIAAIVRDVFYPVSYTHLTLPTKRIV